MANDLATRMRPAEIAEVWGNDKAKKTLINLLGNDRRPQVYLFTGPAGCGKTTMARAYASELGIDTVGLTEINMSDHTGVDSIRALIDEAGYSVADKTGYVLDEIHQLSTAGQSAALKLFEEPPKDTYFFLCTTDPQKLSAALKSRCIQITVEPIDEELIIKKLRSVCKSEGLRVSTEVLEAIADKAEGVPRRALKLLDKVANIDEEEALSILNSEIAGDAADDPDVREICSMLLNNKGSWKDIAGHLRNVKSADAEGIRRMIAGYMAAVLLNSGNAVAATILQEFTESLFSSGYPGLVLQCYSAFREVRG